MKRKRRHPASIIRQEPCTCFLCARVGLNIKYTELERHHIFFGSANRIKAEEHGLTVNLCKWHHLVVHSNVKESRKLQAYAQGVWESLPGNGREQWMDLFHRNYRED